MKNLRNIQSLKKQQGFTLVEIIIAGVLMVGMMLAAGVFTFSADNSKSTNILSIIKELGAATTRYNATTSVTPKAPESLFDKSKNTSTDTFEGVDATSSWRGPYINGFAAGPSGEYPLDSYVASASATFAQITSGLPGGSSLGYEVVASGLPESLIKQIVADCNGTDTTVGLPSDHSGGEKCAATVDTTTHIGSVQYLFTAK